MKKYAEFVCNNRIAILIVALLLLIPSFIGMKATKINYDILVYLPEDIETVKGQGILTDDFDMGAFAISSIEGLSSKQILDLEEKIEKVDGVNKVITSYDIIGNTIPLEMLPHNVVDKIHNGDADLMLITFRDSTSAESTLNAVREVKEITNGACKIGGMSAVVLDTMDLSEKEITIYIIIAVILCLLVLEFSLDSYLVPIILLGNIGVSILFNLGTNIFLGEISYITKALVAVLQLGVTTDFSIFLYHSYENAKKNHTRRIDAMKDAICETMNSVVGSSLTTIAGFLVLCAMQLTLGKDLGIVMAKGVTLGVVSVLTVFPSLVLVLDNAITKTKHKQLMPKFERLSKFIVKYNKVALVVFLVLLIPMYIANTKTEVYYKLDDTLPKYLDSIVANTELAEKFNVVSPEIILVDKDLKPTKVDEMVEEIKNVDGIDFVLSTSELSKYGINMNVLSEDVKNAFVSDKYQMIMVNSSYDIATNELNNQVEVVQNIINKYDDKAILAGEGPLMKDLVKISNQDFNSVNIWSISVIMLIMFVVLKSVSLPFILVLAIENAIFINLGIPYFNGTVLPFIASIVLGTIQLGATIDYAILLTNTYLSKRREGIEKYKSMEETLSTCISAIFTSGLCFFAATFGVGVYSDLEMISSLCTLISRGAIISMLVVITVLPSLLLTLDKLIIKTTKGFKKESVNMNKTIKKLAVSVMALSVLFTSMPVYALTKNETVYATMESNGKVKEVKVSEYIANNKKADTINDLSDLSEIINVNGYETFTQNGNKITWNANGNDIFYQGVTTKKLPVDVNVKYYLNGKEKSLDEILGQKGTVKIKVNYTNKDKHSVKINGKYETLYTPFVVTTAMVISGNENDVDVDYGKVVNNGKSNIVAGISAPGLMKSLGLSDDYNSVTVTIKTDNFELPTIYSVITPKVLNSSDLQIFDKLDNMLDKTKDMRKNASKLGKGVYELREGSKKINTGANKMSESVLASLDSVSKLNEGAIGVDNGLQGLIAAIKQSDTSKVKMLESKNSEAAATILKQNPTLKTTYEKYDLGSKTNEQVYAINPDLLTVKSTYEIVLLLNANNEALKTLTTSISTIEQKLELLEGYSKQIADGTTKMYKSMNELSVGLNTLSKGTTALDNGMAELQNGLTVFGSKGVDVLEKYTNELSRVESRSKNLVKLGENYDSFSISTNSTKSNTKFIYVIDGAKKEEHKEVKTEIKTKSSFWERVKNLFR